jgi:hypothetical protein
MGRILGSMFMTMGTLITALHLRQKSIISSGPASACAPAVGAPHTDSQCLPVDNQYFGDGKTEGGTEGGTGGGLETF